MILALLSLNIIFIFTLLLYPRRICLSQNVQYCMERPAFDFEYSLTIRCKHNGQVGTSNNNTMNFTSTTTRGNRPCSVNYYSNRRMFMTVCLLRINYYNLCHGNAV
jgi:hypothetical protein